MAVPFVMPSIVWTSDLHLDHVSADVKLMLAGQLRTAPGAVLVVAGDVSVASRLTTDLEFLANATARPLCFVLGNHDHYGATIATVRDNVVELAARRPDIRWLPPAGVIQLDTATALVGVDGWADGRLGDPLATPLVLNDDRLIGELAGATTRPGKLAVKRALADADAARLKVLLGRAVTAAKTIVIATHVPPFAEALPKSGRLSHAHWLPLIVSTATGSVLKHFAAEHPDRKFVVLCGHIHVSNDVMIAENLHCIVAGARYGEPRVATLEV